jgi:very-short-patch-repair endonuclease
MVIKNITSKGHWCSYCSHQKLCENNECEMCFNNSFASVERSKFLRDKNINSRTLFKSTNKKFEFDCDVCNKVFACQLSGITKGVWCSFCVNKTELILFDKLKEKYITLKTQYKVDWCKNIKHLPFDFVIEERKIIVELDGKQHFEQIGNWLSPEETRKNDLFKMKCANENGFSVIRILQKDVYKNKYDWLSELCKNIEKITNEKSVQNIYMCKNNEYKDFDI